MQFFNNIFLFWVFEEMIFLVFTVRYFLPFFNQNTHFDFLLHVCAMEATYCTPFWNIFFILYHQFFSFFRRFWIKSQPFTFFCHFCQVFHENPCLLTDLSCSEMHLAVGDERGNVFLFLLSDLPIIFVFPASSNEMYVLLVFYIEHFCF